MHIAVLPAVQGMVVVPMTNTMAAVNARPTQSQLRTGLLASAVNHASYSPHNEGITDEAHGIIVNYLIRSAEDEFRNEVESGLQPLGDGNTFGSATPTAATQKHGESLQADVQRKGNSVVGCEFAVYAHMTPGRERNAREDGDEDAVGMCGSGRAEHSRSGDSEGDVRTAPRDLQYPPNKRRRPGRI